MMSITEPSLIQITMPSCSVCLPFGLPIRSPSVCLLDLACFTLPHARHDYMLPLDSWFKFILLYLCDTASAAAKACRRWITAYTARVPPWMSPSEPERARLLEQLPRQTSNLRTSRPHLFWTWRHRRTSLYHRRPPSDPKGPGLLPHLVSSQMQPHLLRIAVIPWSVH